MSVFWDQLARQVDDAHAEMRMEQQRQNLQQFDEAWATRPVMVDNGPVIVAMLIPMTIGILLGAIGHMVWLAVRG